MIKVANNIQRMLKKAGRPQVDNPNKAPVYFPILNPSSNQLANYGIYAGGGGLAGAGIGTLINALRGQSKLKGALMGALIGAGSGAAVKGIGDYSLDRHVIDKEGKKYPKLTKALDSLGVSPSQVYRANKERIDAEPDKIDMPLTRNEEWVESGFDPATMTLIRPDWLPSWVPTAGIYTDEHADYYKEKYAPKAKPSQK
jgi:hypothetical protein